MHGWWKEGHATMERYPMEDVVRTAKTRKWRHTKGCQEKKPNLFSKYKEKRKGKECVDQGNMDCQKRISVEDQLKREQLFLTSRKNCILESLLSVLQELQRSLYRVLESTQYFAEANYVSFVTEWKHSYYFYYALLLVMGNLRSHIDYSMPPLTKW